LQSHSPDETRWRHGVSIRIENIATFIESIQIE
jgi:hypothetical protein